MNKTKTILAATGGVILVAVLAAGFFAWSAYSSKTAALEGDDEGNDGYESVVDRAGMFLKKRPYPSAQSVKELAAAKDVVGEWKEANLRRSERGDRPPAPTTDAAFKEFIVADARRLTSLPAATTNKMLEATFEFGPFRPYITEGKMPGRSELDELQRQWDDISLILETLAASGVERVNAVDVKKAPAKTEAQPKDAKKNRKPNRSAKADTGFTTKPYTYVFALKTQPAALVRALNAFATVERFIVVDDFSFLRENDPIDAALSGDGRDEPKKPTRARARSGRGRNRDVAEEEKPAGPRILSVTDPATNAPLDAKLTITVHDFGSLAEAEEKEEKK